MNSPELNKRIVLTTWSSESPLFYHGPPTHFPTLKVSL